MHGCKPTLLTSSPSPFTGPLDSFNGPLDSIAVPCEFTREHGDDLFRLRGGMDAALLSDLGISVLVLLGVAFAARSGSSLVAAVFSTAPTGVPLSLWLVHRAGDTVMVENFLLACTKGAAALACFCLGALALVRTSPTPSFAALLSVGFASWAFAWVLLRRM